MTELSAKIVEVKYDSATAKLHFSFRWMKNGKKLRGLGSREQSSIRILSRDSKEAVWLAIENRIREIMRKRLSKADERFDGLNGRIVRLED